MKSTKIDLSMKWYISTKPYDNYDDYDWYYLNLLKKIFELLDKKNIKESLKITNDDIRELSFCLTGYFEDIINESGIWAGLIKKHRELYNKPLPLFETADSYNDGDLNIEDINFVIWYFLSVNSFGEITYSPNNYVIDYIAQVVFTMFDEQYEQAYGTEYYEGFFNIKETDDYFLVREKLHWFAFQSFLTGPELKRYHDDSITRYIEADDGETEPERLISYAIPIINDEAIYKKATKCSALRAIELFAETVNTTGPCKKTLLDLTKKHWGLYKYLGPDGKYVVFENISTNKKYNVLFDSFGSFKGIKEAGIYLTGFIKWNGEWWLSGNIISYDRTEKEIQKWKFENQSALYDYDDEYKERSLDTQKENYTDFLEFIKESYVFTNSYQQVEEKTKGYYQYMNKKRSIAAGIEPKEQMSPSGGFLPKDAQGFNDYCMYFNPDRGVEFIFHIKKILKTIAELDENTSIEDKVIVFNFLFSEAVSANFVKELSNDYDLSNIKHLFLMNEFDMDYDFEFILRFYKPDDFLDKSPNISLYDSSQGIPFDELKE